MNGGVLIENTYDYQNRRVKKTVKQLKDSNPLYPASSTNGTLKLLYTTSFLYDNSRLIYERIEDAAGEVKETQYFLGPDLSGSLNGVDGVGGLLAVSIDGDYYFPQYDSIGNIHTYIDENGKLAAYGDFEPFGGMICGGERIANRFHIWFSTKYFDRETKLYYFGNRFYSPILNRWISPDPIGEAGGENLYCFVYNNPLLNIDPNGHIPLETIWDIANVIYDICVGDYVALSMDVAAMVVPYVPAGGTKFAKTAKLSDVKDIDLCKKPNEIKVTYQYAKARDYKDGRHIVTKSAVNKNWVKRTSNGVASKFLPGWENPEINP